MESTQTPDLRYPIGTYTPPERITDAHLQEYIQAIAEAPAQLRQAVQGLTDTQWLTPYRPGGWTIRQVVHHVPDSHMNAYIRLKMALTEENPTIKPYMEDRWAELVDSQHMPPEVSLTLLDMLHQRWVAILRSLSPADFSRTFRHPELGTISLDRATGMYAWHGRHHIAHITSLRTRMGW
jgi:hypothetical protein